MAKRDDERKNVVSDIVKSRLSRVPSANSGGLQAMSIGLVLGGCVAFGYFVGAWLDGKFRTSFCMPTGVFLGLAAGFREMFVTLKHLSAQTKWPSATSHLDVASSQNSASNAANSQDRVLDLQDAAAQNAADAKSVEMETVRPRIFKVPPPPTSRFDTPEFATPESSRQKESSSSDDDLETENTDTQGLTRQLLTPDTDSAPPNSRESNDVSNSPQ